MAFIEVHQSLRDHRKIFTLATELDMPEAHVAGHCVFLWLWAIDNAEDGVLPGSERMIERAAGWQGTSGQLIAGMIVAGMLDRDEDGTLHIHDWMDYAGRLIEKRHENAQRMRDARAAKAADTPNKRAAHVQRTSSARAGATLQYRTQQYTTESEESVSTKRGASAPRDDASSEPEKPGKNGRKVTWPERKPSDTTDRAYYERVLKEASELDAIPMLVNLAHAKIGADNTPGCESYGRIGALAKKHGAALVGVRILEAANAHIAGDPLDYLTSLFTPKSKRASQNGHVTTSGRQQTYAKTGEDTAPVGWK